MLTKDKPIERMYYKIGEVAKMFDVNASQIRFWTNEFDILQPKLTKKGDRQYTLQDIEVLKVIFYLVKVQGLKLDGVKKYLEENKTSIVHDIKTDKTQQSKLENKLKYIKRKLIEMRDKL